MFLPAFRYYALADGIKDILLKAGKGTLLDGCEGHRTGHRTKRRGQVHYWVRECRRYNGTLRSGGVRVPETSYRTSSAVKTL